METSEIRQRIVHMLERSKRLSASHREQADRVAKQFETLLPAAALLTLSLISGCQGATTRAVKMGPVDTGATSLEFVRRQLKGTWELTALEVAYLEHAGLTVTSSAGLGIVDVGQR
jgi:hypothetical protein